LNIQILWQTGEKYYDDYSNNECENVKVLKYFNDISSAYSAADLIIARAGATTIAEVAQLGLPVIFVPSPNVAADHQFKNAEVLKNVKAAELLRDNELNNSITEKVENLINNKDELIELGKNIKKFAKPDAINTIANEIIKMARII